MQLLFGEIKIFSQGSYPSFNMRVLSQLSVLKNEHDTLWFFPAYVPVGWPVLLKRAVLVCWAAIAEYLRLGDGRPEVQGQGSRPWFLGRPLSLACRPFFCILTIVFPWFSTTGALMSLSFLKSTSILLD